VLELLTDIESLNRIDYTFASNAVSGYQGDWVAQTSTVGTVALTTTSVGGALQIWTETGDRSATPTVGSWSPDVAETGKITVIQGNYRGRTDQYTEVAAAGGTLALGDPLRTWSGGQMSKAVLGTDYIVGYVTKLDVSGNYTSDTGQVFEKVIEFITA